MSLRGSAIGDMGAAGQGDSFVVGAEVPEELTAIYGQHEVVKQQVADDYSDYQETGGHNFDPRGGEGRMSTFTASGSFGGGITGPARHRADRDRHLHRPHEVRPEGLRRDEAGVREDDAESGAVRAPTGTARRS